MLAWSLVLGVGLTNGYSVGPGNLSKWDATLYQSVAEHGYQFFPCAGQSMWGGQSWCGNTGWFPLLPWLTKLLAVVVRSVPVASILISASCFYGVLWLIWNWLLGSELTIENGLLLLLAAFFPGGLYYVAPYPLTLYLLLFLLASKALLEGRLVRAGLLGGVASLSYSSAPALVLTFAAYLIIANRKKSLMQLLKPVAIVCGLSGLGYLAFLAYLQIAVGHWDANLKVLGKYGVGLYDPLATVLQRAVAMFRGEYRAREEFQGFQSLLCAGLVWTLTVVTTRDREKPPSPLESLCLTQGVTFWLFPLLLGASVLPWRTEALLLPTIVLFKRYSRPTQAILLPIFVLLEGELTLQYFKNWLP